MERVMQYSDPAWLNAEDRLGGQTLPNNFMKGRKTRLHLSPDQNFFRGALISGLRVVDLALPATARAMEQQQIYKDQNDGKGKGRRLIYPMSVLAGLVADAVGLAAADGAYTGIYNLSSHNPHGDPVSSAIFAGIAALATKFGANILEHIGCQFIQAPINGWGYGE